MRNERQKIYCGSFGLRFCMMRLQAAASERLIKQPDEYVVIEGVRSGKGMVKVFRAPIRKDSAYAAVMRMELAPGASVGLHQHKEDEEVYAIVSGTGLFLYEGGECPAKGGDVFVTHKGMYHGLKNLSADSPLVYFAVPTRPNLTEAGKAAGKAAE